MCALAYGNRAQFGASYPAMSLHIPPPARRVARAAAAACVLAAVAACTTTPLPPMAPLTSSPPSTVPAPPPPPVAPAAPPVAMAQPVPRSPAMGSQVFMPPTQGPRVSRFDGDKVKGIDFGGRPGDPILASRTGRVVLISSALPSYGTMIVVKHDDDFITAYAHIGSALVKEGDEVQQGQRIADMGADASNRGGGLYFEIRKQGVAVDPAPFLDGRQP